MLLIIVQEWKSLSNCCKIYKLHSLKGNLIYKYSKHHLSIASTSGSTC